MDKYIFGDFRLDTGQWVLFHNNEQVSLGTLKFRILKLILDKRDTLVPYAEFWKTIWGEEYGPREDLHVPMHKVNEHVDKIKDILGRYGKCIKNVRGMGYLFSNDILKEIEEGSNPDTTNAAFGGENQTIIEPFNLIPSVQGAAESDFSDLVRRTGGSGPSASEFVRQQVQSMISSLAQSRSLSDSIIKNIIEESLSGRDQLLQPLAAFFRGVAEDAQKPRSTPQTAVIKAGEHFLQDCERAQGEIAKRVCNILQNNDAGLVDVIILADFSVTIARTLREMATNNPKRVKAVTVYLIVSGRHFNIQEDTARWELEFKKQDLQRFYLFEHRVPFEELDAPFEQIDRGGKRAVMLMGIERAYPEGQFLDWPGMGILFHAAGMHSIDVVVVAECYKVQPMLPREIPRKGISIYGSQIELSSIQIGPGVHFVSDHAVHAAQSRPSLEGGSLKCCYRFWRNRMERKQYPIAVIFDLDGTIIDSEEIHKKLYQQSAESLGFDLTDSIYFSELRGLTDEETFKRILRLSGKKGDAIKLIDEKQQKFLRYLSQGLLRPIPGVIEYIRSLSRQGHILALATSATTEEARLALQSFGISSIFQTIITSENVVVGKPSPEVYLKAVHALSLESNECLVYEDSIAGIHSAVAAQIQVVAVGDVRDEELQRSGAEFVIPHFLKHELPELRLAMSVRSRS